MITPSFPANRTRGRIAKASLCGLGLLLIAIGAGSLQSSSTAFAAKEPPAEWDGLKRVASNDVDHLYKRPDATLTAYDAVKLDPIMVEFDKNWDPNRGGGSLQSRVNNQDIEKIKADLASAFQEEFTNALTKAGYKVVTEDGNNVLRVSAAIANLYITAPAKITSERTRSYTTETGRMTLVAELRDSVTNALLARAVDTERGRESHNFMLTTSASNSADARMALSQWAGVLVKSLDAAEGRSKPRTG
jgi:Protein of unknown function (DUF3313)